LTVGNFNSGMGTQPALASRGIRSDAIKFGWIGAPVKGFPTCMIMRFAGFKTLDEMFQKSPRSNLAAPARAPRPMTCPNS